VNYAIQYILSVRGTTMIRRGRANLVCFRAALVLLGWGLVATSANAQTLLPSTIQSHAGS